MGTGTGMGGGGHESQHGGREQMTASRGCVPRRKPHYIAKHGLETYTTFAISLPSVVGEAGCP